MEITKETVLRAWRDEDYAKSLPEDVRGAIPARPTAEDGSALSDEKLEEVAGGTTFVAGATIVAGGTGGLLGGFGLGELMD